MCLYYSLLNIYMVHLLTFIVRNTETEKSNKLINSKMLNTYKYKDITLDIIKKIFFFKIKNK